MTKSCYSGLFSLFAHFNLWGHSVFWFQLYVLTNHNSHAKFQPMELLEWQTCVPLTRQGFDIHKQDGRGGFTWFFNLLCISLPWIRSLRITQQAYSLSGSNKLLPVLESCAKKMHKFRKQLDWRKVPEDSVNNEDTTFGTRNPWAENHSIRSSLSCSFLSWLLVEFWTSCTCTDLNSSVALQLCISSRVSPSTAS